MRHHFTVIRLAKRKRLIRGAWAPQSVKRLTSAQVTISRFMGSSPASGSVLTAQNLESASDSVSSSCSALPHLMSFSVSLKFFLKGNGRNSPAERGGKDLQEKGNARANQYTVV